MPNLTWLITGISGGFGRLMTEQLLERGDQVAGTARKLEAVDDLKSRYQVQLWLGSLDLTDLPAIHRVVDAAFAAFSGRIDVTVNNAGYGLIGVGQHGLWPGAPGVREHPSRSRTQEDRRRILCTPGDPAKMVRAIISSVDEENAPKRLVLGSDAYTMIHEALTERLARLEAQKDLAVSTDFSPSSVE